MCGICGSATTLGSRPSCGVEGVLRIASRLAHRGPDDEGHFDAGHAIFAHRRLAVIDPSPAGRQPMATPDGAHVLVYNGELYNDAELRAELSREGVRFASSCDAETVLHLLARRGEAGLRAMRGMYALALLDVSRATLLLARDPLGIKPLYVWHPGSSHAREVVFSSEIGALLAHPRFEASPDLHVVSAYLTTIRTTLGERTLFHGVATLMPGEARVYDLRRGDLPFRRSERAGADRAPDSPRDAVAAARLAIEDSVRRHLRTDVPCCALLSGGLDSTIIASLAAREIAPRDLRTYCVGATDDDENPGAPTALATPATDDLEFSRVAAASIGSTHAVHRVGRDRFLDRWREMIDRLALPLSTPNEVAILEVAERLRADGCVVALSGEGADELFAGYDVSMNAAAAFFEHSPCASAREHASFALEHMAWIPTGAKASVLRDDVWRALERDEAMAAWYAGEIECLRELIGNRANPGLRTHLALLQRVNLAGLLARLDTATMLAGVEGRTPFADASVARFAATLPMGAMFDAGKGASGSKVVLRRAFADAVPAPILSRAKASFPMPFERWMDDAVGLLRSSEIIARLFRPEAVEAVVRWPRDAWRFAWPMLNLAKWGARMGW